VASKQFERHKNPIHVSQNTVWATCILSCLFSNKDFRIYEHDSPKTTRKAQCSCPIYAEGKLDCGKVPQAQERWAKRLELGLATKSLSGKVPGSRRRTLLYGIRLRCVRTVSG
jgi:hypothetical protein